MNNKENLLKIAKPLPILFIFIYMVGGYIVATIEELTGMAYWVTIIGFGFGGISMGRSVLENKYRAMWFAIAAALLGITTGILIGHIEKSVEWGAIYFLLGTSIGYESYGGWKKILIGGAIGLLVALLAGTKMSFGDLKIENKALHLTISMVTGILIGGFWGSIFPSKGKGISSS